MEDSITEYTQANRLAWIEATTVHQFIFGIIYDMSNFQPKVHTPKIKS